MNENQNEPNINTKGEYAKYVSDQIEHVFQGYFTTISNLENDEKQSHYEPYIAFMDRALNAYYQLHLSIERWGDDNDDTYDV